MKRTISIILSAVMLCSAAACSSEGSSSSKAESSESEVKTTEAVEIDPSNPPEKLDLRNYNGKNYVTPIKSQLFGDCWTFAQAGAAEISYLFANNMGVPAGKENDQVNFSEKYISWYVFHGITKDDVVKGRVRASQVGEGFDISEVEKNNPRAAFIIGGEFIGNTTLFESGFGPVDESVTVKGETPYAYDDLWEGEWSLPLNAKYRNAPVSAFMKSAVQIPSPANIDADGKYSFNEDGLKSIKTELCKGHGVTIALRANQMGFNKTKKVAYDGEVAIADHAVIIVGYDDTYSKDNFTMKDKSGKAIEGTTPQADGAFIIKNSWGLANMDKDPDDGYLYLSYYDHNLTPALSYVFDAKSDNYSALNYDQYDLMITQWYGSTDYEGETKTANVFDAEEDENLFQIAYSTALPNTEVSFEVYKDVKEGNPASGTLLEKGVNTHDSKGFYKIDLKEQYSLKKGEKYSVVLTMKRKTDSGTAYTEIFPYSTEFSTGLKVRGIINKGESFIYTDGKWSDMSENKDSLIQRAFKQGKEEIGSRKTAIPIQLESKDTFAVDNYPIKAISIPSI